jgi:esterase/lipase/1-acyl-sn-glycerol-3-phosphate acyltransferase
MNRFAYLATGQAIRMLSGFSEAEVNLHGTENIPRGSIIFVVNHFTRIETLLMPFHIYQLTKVPVWSLADFTLFEGPMRGYLDSVGVVSTKDPHRDLLIVKSLLTGEANWIIYPEGEMVKDKMIVEATRFMITTAGGKRPPHSGAAVLALRTEFYRQRLARMAELNPAEAERLKELFQIDSLEPVLNRNTWIVPVNITYYPIRAHENALSRLASRLVKDLSARAQEEIMTEGTLLLSDTDIDIRFGAPISIKEYLVPPIDRDIVSPRRIDFDDPLPSRAKILRVAVGIMHRYMDAIYSMTTVNHDHLFASMLRVVPLLKMNEDNLRRRVFLVVAEHLEQTGVHLHRSLRTNQSSLLTDDRFHKYRDFIRLAMDTGIVRTEGKDLFKDMSKFSSPFDFNRARIDNPVAVIANEVIPLKHLQKKIEAIAWMAPFQLRHRIAVYLQKKGEKEFAEDYAAFFAKGESKPQEIGAPRLIRGKSHELGVVLLHGFMAAPYEMKELADYLGRRGVWVYVPRVKGHGTSAPDLATRTSRDWLESVDEAYVMMSNICRRVVVGGFSFGGGLALDLAARVPEVAGVFAVCPPMRLQDLSSRFAQAADLWNRLMDMAHYASAKKEFVEISLEHPQINYARLPISGISEMERFMAALVPKLTGIRIPALVVQSLGDPVVDPAGSRSLFEGLASEEKEYLAFDFDRHGILLDAGAERVHAAVADFVERVSTGEPVRQKKSQSAEHLPVQKPA